MPDDPVRRSMLDIAVLPGPQTTLAVSGELDPSTAPDLAARISELAADPAISSIALDLAGVTFLDSSGLRTLVTSREELRAIGSDLTLRRPNPNVRRVLEVSGLTEIITVE